MCTWRRLAVAPAARVRAAGGGARAGAAGRADHRGGGTVTVSGEATVTIGSRDDVAFFNYTDYEHNALRMFRVSLSGMWRPVARLAVPRGAPVGGRAATSSPTRSTSASGRGRAAPLDIQAGRIPPVFGAFGRRSYGARQSADRLSPRLPVPDVAAAGRHAGDRRRSAGHAGARLARELPRRRDRRGPGRAARHRLPLGHGGRRRARRRAARGGGRGHRRARSRTRAWTTTTAGGRSRAASPGSRSSAWSSAHPRRAASS